VVAAGSAIIGLRPSTDNGFLSSGALSTRVPSNSF